MTEYDTSKVYIQYVEDVLNDRITTCKYVKQACQRMKDWFDKDDRYFDYSDADQKIRFMQKLKHTKAPHTGQPFVLEPYQAWIVAHIIGWKWIIDGQKTDDRLINNALLMLSRKAGKTFFAAALMLAITVNTS